MKFFKWQPGRQEATKNILKFPIWSWLGFDVYLLKLPKNQVIFPHTDKVEGAEHHRINITLYGNWYLQHDNQTFHEVIGDMHYFRPDEVEHSAIVVKQSLLLSIGWTKKQPPTE